MKIKNLSEILAEMGDTSISARLDNQKNTQKSHKQDPNQPTTIKKQPSSTSYITTQPIVNPSDNNKLATILANVHAEPWVDDSRENRYLRWLAFYYLAQREHSRYELGKKLLAKGCDATAVALLLDEFADKGYQSDERFAHMVVREHLRKGRGQAAIKLTLKQAKAKLPVDIDELVNEAIAQSAADGTALDDQTNADWLKLAIAARCKKYGDNLPTDAKDKARQLRFLQYRGFELSICFDALKYTPQSYADEYS